MIGSGALSPAKYAPTRVGKSTLGNGSPSGHVPVHIPLLDTRGSNEGMEARVSDASRPTSQLCKPQHVSFPQICLFVKISVIWRRGLVEKVIHMASCSACLSLRSSRQLGRTPHSLDSEIDVNKLGNYRTSTRNLASVLGSLRPTEFRRELSLSSSRYPYAAGGTMRRAHDPTNKTRQITAHNVEGPGSRLRFLSFQHAGPRLDLHPSRERPGTDSNEQTSCSVRTCMASCPRRTN
jgi:hypothetical protein